ncbi:MAG: thioredoxin family protein [Bacteroidetes bacterium]|nr:thioredoxin family protein [Bacteroidota bacterium]
MKRLLSILFITLASFVMNGQTGSKKEELVWFTDLMKANEAATKENKPIFAFFTGSDWCVWCRKLQQDVFAKTDFIKWAKANVVLMELDFPRGKQQAPEVVQQNNQLQQLFGVKGYPTIWLFNMKKDDATGKYNINSLGSLGYPQGAVQGKEEVKFLEDGNLLLKQQPTGK